MSSNITLAPADIGTLTAAEINNAISVKQDKLTGSTIQVVGFDANGKAIAVSRWSNPNLLDNAYWAIRDAIINQRGQDLYTEFGYTIDRWTNQSEGDITIEITDGALLIKSNSGKPSWFTEYIAYPLPAGTVYTLSVLVESITGTASFGDNESSFGFSSAGLYAQTRTVTSQVSFATLSVFGNARIKAVKLELGPTQTLAHKEGDTWVLNAPPPDKALELLKCQRYFKRVLGGWNSASFGTGKNESWGKYILGGMRFSPIMRAVPTIKIYSVWDKATGADVPFFTQPEYIGTDESCAGLHFTNNNTISLVDGHEYSVNMDFSSDL